MTIESSPFSQGVAYKLCLILSRLLCVSACVCVRACVHMCLCTLWRSTTSLDCWLLFCVGIAPSLYNFISTSVKSVTVVSPAVGSQLTMLATMNSWWAWVVAALLQHTVGSCCVIPRDWRYRRCMWRSEGSLWESVLSIHVVPRESTEVISHGGRCLSLVT